MSEPAVFDVVCVPIGEYRHADHPTLPADEEAERVAGVLAELGGVPRHWTVPGEQRHRTNVDDRLAAWSAPDAVRNSMMYWVGHGESDGLHAQLATWDSPSPIGARGVTPETLAQHIHTEWELRHATEGAWTIVVIEACGAKRFVQKLSSVLQGEPNVPERLAMIGVSSDGAGHLGEFRVALREAIASYTDNDDTIRLDDLVNRIRGRLPEGWVQDLELHRAHPFLRRGVLPGTVTAPVDIYRELRAFLTNLSPDERGHFFPKAQGAEHGELAWYFVGRVGERARITAWLRQRTAGMVVVTGEAGSGKSALLGNVLVHTNPELRDLLVRAGHLEPLPPEERPPDRVFDAVIHLTGMTVDDVVSRLAAVAGLAPTPDATPDLEVVLRALGASPCTVLVDALDEAQEPVQIAASVLRRIAELPAGRVVVGTRRSTSEGPDQPAPADEDLLDALGRDATTLIVDRDPDAIATYVRRRLTAAGAVDTDRVVELVSAGSRQFLFARLAIHEILARPALLTPERADDLVALLGQDHRTLFAAAVERLTALAPVNGALLEALALAQGRGLPRADRIWSLVATALTGTPVTELDIDGLLTAAAPYVMLDAQDGQSVYRLAHAVFREHYAVTGDTLAELHRQVAEALVRDALARLPAAPNPYVARQLSAHIGAAETWADLAEVTELLDHLNPDAVASDAFRSAFGRSNLPAGVAAILAARHNLVDQPPQLRAGTRQLAALRLTNALIPAPPDARWTVRWARMRTDPLQMVLFGHTGAVNRMTTVSMPDGRVLLVTAGADGTVRLWDTASGAAATPPLAGHSGAITEVVVIDHQGRMLLVTGGKDGTVRFWDLANGERYGTARQAHQGTVTALTPVPLADQRTGVASAGEDGQVYVWDPAASAPVWHLSGHSGPVNALAVLRHRGPVVLASGGDDGIRLWNVRTGKPARQPLTSGAPVTALAVVTDDRRDLLAAGDTDGEVEVWEVRDGTRERRLSATGSEVLSLAEVPGRSGRRALAVIRRPGHLRIWDPRTDEELSPRGHTGSLSRMALLRLADRNLVAAGGDNGSVWLWGAVSGELTSVLTGHTKPVTAMASVTLADGRVLLAAGADDGTVRLWDPASTFFAGRPLAGHTDWVHAVTAAPMPDGRVLVASGSYDGTVRLWDPVTSEPAGAPLVGHTGAVVALATVPGANGQVLLVTGSADRTARLWDLASGTPVGEPFAGHTDRINAVTPYGPALLATASRDGTIRRWDLDTGEEIGAPLTGHTGPVNAVAAVALPAGRLLLASGGQDGTVRLWDPTTGRPVGAPLTGHTGQVTALVALPGQASLASAGTDEVIRLWTLTTERPTHSELTGHTDTVTGLAALPRLDGSTLLASISHDGTMRTWNPVTEKVVDVQPAGHGSWVKAVASVPMRGRVLLATGGNDNLVRLQDQTVRYAGGTKSLTALALPDGRQAIATVGTDDVVRLWESATGTYLDELETSSPGGITAITTVRLPTHTVFAIACLDGLVRLWRPTTGMPTADMETLPWPMVMATLAMPDGTTALATTSLDKIRLWNPVTLRPLRRSPFRAWNLSLAGTVSAMHASTLGDGRTVLVMGGLVGNIRFWHPADRRPSEPLTGHSDTVTCLGVVPLADNRSLVASGSADHTVRLWDLTRRASVATLSGHEATVTAVVPLGGHLLASGSEDETVRIWDPVVGRELFVLKVGSAVRDLAALDGSLAVGLDDGVAVLDLTV